MSISDYELRRVNRGARDNALFSVIVGLILGGFILGVALSGTRSEWWFIAAGIAFAIVIGGIGLAGVKLLGQVHYQRGYLDGRKGVFKP